MSILLYSKLWKCGEAVYSQHYYSIPRVVGYDDIVPVEGSAVNFICPPGLALAGLNSAICTENGEWEPDSRVIMCYYLTSDLRGLICNDSKGYKIGSNSSKSIYGKGGLGFILLM